jgi:hypothetical protein
VGHEQRRRAQRLLQGADQPVEDPLAADGLEPLGAPAEPGGAAAGEDGAAGLVTRQ